MSISGFGWVQKSYNDRFWPGSCRNRAAKTEPISVDFPAPFSPHDGDQARTQRFKVNADSVAESLADALQTKLKDSHGDFFLLPFCRLPGLVILPAAIVLTKLACMDGKKHRARPADDELVTRCGRMAAELKIRGRSLGSTLRDLSQVIGCGPSSFLYAELRGE